MVEYRMHEPWSHEGQLTRTLTRCVSEEIASPLCMNGEVGLGQSGLRHLASESHALTRGVGSWGGCHGTVSAEQAPARPVTE